MFPAEPWTALPAFHFEDVNVEAIRLRCYTGGPKLEIRGLTGFERDLGNWRKSEEKHGVAASEAKEALLGDPIVRVDPFHSADEQSFVALGRTEAGRRLFLSFTIRRNRVRVISARPMSRRERETYEKAEKPNK